MPTLHQYRNRNACYVLTAIRGAVVTFQLTPEGERKLKTAGIYPGNRFQRAILLDLYRTGDAFTRGATPDDPALAAAAQIELDFTNDPDPETAFPVCDLCKGVTDLHLTLTGKPEDLIAQLQCDACRAIPAARPDTSIPVVLLSRPILSRLFELNPVAKKSPNVRQFENLLRAEFESKWEALRKSRRPSQQSLLDPPSDNGLNLGN